MVKLKWVAASFLGFSLLAFADSTIVINPSPGSPGNIDAGAINATSVTTPIATVGFLDAGTAQVAGALTAGSVTTPGLDAGLVQTAKVENQTGVTFFSLGATDLNLQVNSVNQGDISSSGFSLYNEVSVFDQNVFNAVQLKGSATGLPVQIAPNGSDTNVTMVVAGQGSGGIKLNSGTAVTNFCVCSQGGCSMGAAATTCSCNCTGCVTGSVCFSSPFSNSSGTDAVGVQTQCSAGTVTLTAKTGPVTGAETFNVQCFN